MTIFDLNNMFLGAEQPREASPVAMFVILGIGVVLFYLIMMRPALRDRRKHEDLIKSLKKNDKVLTTGGLIGSFISTSPDGAEITLRVDDNFKLKFHRNYIVGVLNEEKKDS